MKEKVLINKYNELVRGVESMKIYDGRGKGIDQYECEKCGATFYTQYADKGVTPFSMRCRSGNCNGVMVHNGTISVVESIKAKIDVVSWVRPSLKDFLKMTPAAQEHVLKGGLILDTDL